MHCELYLMPKEYHHNVHVFILYIHYSTIIILCIYYTIPNLIKNIVLLNWCLYIYYSLRIGILVWKGLFIILDILTCSNWQSLCLVKSRYILIFLSQLRTVSKNSCPCHARENHARMSWTAWPKYKFTFKVSYTLIVS